MGLRTELQSLLEGLIANVYFQPPANLEMAYPCIVYKLDNMTTDFANNTPYLITPRYLVTVIDLDPDSLIPKAVASLPMCLMNRAFVAGNLNHTVFILYF
jgi:hypothetical protein